jgi:hypothetical protein
LRRLYTVITLLCAGLASGRRKTRWEIRKDLLAVFMGVW